ncbi:RPC82 [Candida pseudojiufengensis]|uniref:RPC82 n=1 Tax=Candida pseudojiufengensis TaxID=497109 RepID=UPI00222460D3|nr:RPC82 [Candida pseudojiufengensis]KAI5966707.1 RPC82 [Candida pseudojiufengensis]
MDDDNFDIVKAQSPKSYLYSIVALNHLGEIASKIIITLISNGRLTSKEISNETNLTIKSIKTSLVSLIQLSCINFWYDEKTRQTFYSFNEIGILKLIHSGDILNYITQYYGIEEAEIIQNILEIGHIKLEDYLNQFIDNEKLKLTKERLFLKLFNDDWLKILKIYDYQDINDIWQQIFDDTMAKTPRSATTSEVKRIAEVTSICKEKLIKLLEYQPIETFITKHGSKKLNPKLVLTFNLERYLKHSRTESFTNLSCSRIGFITSKIYEAGLKSIETNSPNLSYPFLKISGLLNLPGDFKEFKLNIERNLISEKKIIFTVKDILKYLPKEIDIRNSTVTFKNTSENDDDDDDEPPTKKIKLENGFKHNNDDEDDEELISTINQHLKFLVSSKFLIEVSPGFYSVPYYQMSHTVQQYNFEMIIKSTLREQAFRILRCIKQLKLADEKAISQQVLLKEKTVRNEIYQLIKANIIEIQEIPRSIDRAASKTFYLFRYKEFQTFENLKNCLIYDMAEILNQIIFFQNENKILLDKCNRKDVEGHEEEYLIDSELKILQFLQNRQIKNIIKFNRIGSLLNIFNL